MSAFETVKKSLKDFILKAAPQIERRVVDLFAPQFLPGEDFQGEVSKGIRPYSKKPYPAQLVVISALVKGFLSRKRVFGLIAEMGCGKSLQSVYVALLVALFVFKRRIRTLIVCPGHLITTWAEEIRAVCGDEARIVTANGRDCLSKLMSLRSQPYEPDRPEFWIVGFNRMKTGARWKTRIRISRDDTLLCPHCGTKLDNLGEDDLGFVYDYAEGWATCKHRLLCSACKTPLWSPQSGDKTYAPVLFIKKYLSRHFSFLICDEVQKMKGGETIQGAILGQLAACIPKSLVLTGTLSGGKASDVFYLLQRAFALNFSKSERAVMLPAFTEIQSFVQQYGALEKTYKADLADSATGRSYRERVSVREIPGISPMLLRNFFLEHCAFLRISDIADALPPYDECLEFVELPDDVQDEYKRMESQLRALALSHMQDGDMTVLGKMVSLLLAWPDMPHMALDVTNKKDQLVYSTVPFPKVPTPKDQRLIEIVKEANSRGRKCLVFVEYTGFGALAYVKETLEDAGLRVLVMTPSIPTEKRLDWIRAKMATGRYDNLLCHPKLVETGLNLLDFPELVFYQTGYSTYTLRQASRRSWRPGQKQNVVVRFLINRNTFQENAMALIASKLEAALILEGELSDKGLVSLSQNGSGLGDLVRELVKTTSQNSLEKVFASYRAVEQAAFATHAAAPHILQEENEPVLEETVSPSEQNTKPFGVAITPKAVRVGELNSYNGQHEYRGRIKRTEVRIDLDSIYLGNGKKYDRAKNLVWCGSGGVLLQQYMLVEEPSLLGYRYGVYVRTA